MTHPSIYIYGDAPYTTEIEGAIEKLSADLTTAPWPENGRATLDDTVTAVVLVSPLGNRSTLSAIRAIRGQPSGAQIPLFAVMTIGSAEREIRNLYEAGASAVFEWPAESELLPYCLAEMVAANFARGRASDPDTALARAVHAQIKTRCDFNHRVRVRVTEGAAFLNGSVNHLWQKRRIKEVAMSVPGLMGVVDADVFVLPTGVSDDDINERIRRMMRDVSEIDERTLAIRVENGYVTLAGSVDSRAEIKRLTRMVEHIRGVRDVKPLTVISPSQKQRDHRIARRLQSTLNDLFIGEDIKVAFFGNSAVLSGTVSNLFAKQRIAQVLEAEGVVDRTVNKLRVSPPAGG